MPVVGLFRVIRLRSQLVWCRIEHGKFSRRELYFPAISARDFRTTFPKKGHSLVQILHIFAEN